MIKKTIFLLIFIFLPKIVFASDQKFAVSYDVHYEVSATGKTTVKENVILTNLTSAYYAKEYRIKPGITDMANLRAYDSQGQLKISNVNNEINVVFNDQIVGVNKQLKWTFVFETNQIANRRGTTWEINLPRPGGEQNITSYMATLTVDKSFGPAAYLNPLPDIGAVGSNGPYTWNKSSIAQTGVLAGFGKFQIYNFNLRYHLSNSKFYPATEELAIPPSTSYQDVYITGIEPKPDDVVIDSDGNWLARYLLGPASNTNILVTGVAAVYPNSKKETVESINSLKLTAADKFWERVNIGASTPKTIYDYVTSRLSYDNNRIVADLDRAGAKQVLTNPKSAICMEFTDLFVAAARTSGIAAREINGYAYTVDDVARPTQLSSNPDILHAWPEYFDGNHWVMVDPTWENTTKGLDFFNQWDFNHLVFVIHGQSSVYPYPAGTYKVDTKVKDVLVSFGNQLPQTNDKPQIISNSYSTTVFNPGPNSITYQGQVLPPFAKRVKYTNVTTPAIVVIGVGSAVIAVVAWMLFVSRRKK